MTAKEEELTALVSRLAIELHAVREQYADVITARAPDLLEEIQTMSDSLDQFIRQPS